MRTKETAPPVHVALVLAKLIEGFANGNTSALPLRTLAWTGKVKLTVLDRLTASEVTPANTVTSCSARPMSQDVNTLPETRKG